MDVQVARRAHVVAAGAQKGVERAHELGAPRGVGRFERPQDVALEGAQLGIVRQVEDQPQRPEPTKVQRRRPRGIGRHAGGDVGGARCLAHGRVVRHLGARHASDARHDRQGLGRERGLEALPQALDPVDDGFGILVIDFGRSRHQHLHAAVARAQQRRHVRQHQPPPRDVQKALVRARHGRAILFTRQLARSEHEHQVRPTQIVAKASGALDQLVVGGHRIVQQVAQKVALHAQTSLDHRRLLGELDGQHRGSAVGDLIVEVDEVVWRADDRQVALDRAPQRQRAQRHAQHRRPCHESR